MQQYRCQRIFKTNKQIKCLFGIAFTVSLFYINRPALFKLQ